MFRFYFWFYILIRPNRRSLWSQVTYLFCVKFLKIFDIVSHLKEEHLCYQVVCPSSPIVELFVYLKYQPFCSSKVSIDKEKLFNIKIKITKYDLMVTAWV